MPMRALFRAGIRPRRAAGRLTRDELTRLHAALATGSEEGDSSLAGSSVSDYVDADGVRGFFQLHHKVYVRERERRAASAGTPLEDASSLAAAPLTTARTARRRSRCLNSYRVDHLLGSDGCADDASLGVVFHDLDGVALERAHLHHLLQVVLQHGQVNEAHVEAGEEDLAGAAMWIVVAVAAASALCQSCLNSRQRGSVPRFAASKTSSGSMSRNRRRIARWPMMPSRCPRPPQPQKFSLSSSVTTVWPPSHTPAA